MRDLDSNGKRILLVEDETAICDLCQRVLSNKGYEVDIAVNGNIAQDIIEKKQHDLYLFDIRLQIIDGEKLYQWLKEKHPQLTNRVIFTTGNVAGQDTVTFIEQTGRPLLPKPFTTNELIAIVSETLREAAR